jgi:transposase
MTFIGVDVHRSSSLVKWMIPATGGSGSRRISTTERDFDKLLAALPRPWIIAYEATRQAPALTKLLRRLHADDLHLVHPRAVALQGMLSKAKTDEKDADIILSLLMDAEKFPAAYLAPPQVEELREISRGYQALRQLGAKLQNHVRCQLNKDGLSCAATSLLSRAGREQVPELIGQLPPFATIITTMYWQLLETIDDFCINLVRLMRAQLKEHPAGPALLQLPGVGPVSAFGFVAEIGAIQRFASCKRLHSYAGLVPVVKQSDTWYQTGHLSQDCSKPLRYFAVCAAQAATRCKDPSAARATYERIKRGDPRRANVAKIAAARKILTDVFWTWQAAVA